MDRRSRMLAQGSHELFDWIRQNVDPAMLKGGYIDCLKDGKVKITLHSKCPNAHTFSFLRVTYHAGTRQVLCALLLAYDPLCIDKTVAQRGGKEAIEAAFAAGAEFGAPRLIDTNDLSEGSIDIRSVTTYLVMLQSAVRRAMSAGQARESRMRAVVIHAPLNAARFRRCSSMTDAGPSWQTKRRRVSFWRQITRPLGSQALRSK
eukprot:3097875-Prymnesium_polylepis.1